MLHTIFQHICVLSSAVTVAALCFMPYQGRADTVVKKRIDNGEDAARFVMVILAEGYTASQEVQFEQDVDRLITKLFSVTPWKEYRNAVNLYTLFTPSEESGADHPLDGIYVDTVYDASFDTNNIARLLTVNDAAALRTATRIPEFDTVIVLVNDTRYGGSGGSVIVASVHEASAEIILHEAGHVIAGLADEYTTPYPGYPPGDGEPNVTFQTQREKIKWKNWIPPETPLPTPDVYPESIGLFEGARYMSSGIFRPAYSCRMRTLNQTFCPICAESIILNIYRYIGLIDAYYPETTDIELEPGKSLRMGIVPAPLGESPHRTFFWDIDGVPFGDDQQQEIVLLPSMLPQGVHTVSVHVRHATDLVKTDPTELLGAHQTWIVNKPFCSGKLSGSITDATRGTPISNAQIDISPGIMTFKTDTNGSFICENLGCGVYTVRATAPGYNSFTQEVSISDARHSTIAIALQPTADSFYLHGSIIGTPKGCTLTLSGARTASTTLSNDGRFTFGPLPPGEYLIIATAPEYLFFPPQQKVTIKDRDITQIRFAAIRLPFPAKKK
ncbi:MAG: M64 family metallo-endopeptidase [Desulfobacterota bacterium]|nr:M64 family metallo-endopeptidase [Thermodesulfobacteriota bacterium]